MKQLLTIEDEDVDDLIEYLELLRDGKTLEEFYKETAYKALGQIEDWLEILRLKE